MISVGFIKYLDRHSRVSSTVCGPNRMSARPIVPEQAKFDNLTSFYTVATLSPTRSAHDARRRLKAGINIRLERDEEFENLPGMPL